MPVGLSDEQRDFAAAVRGFFDREAGTPERRRQLTGGGEHLHNAELYAKLAELGWIGVVVPAAYGGAGAGPVELCVLLQEVYRGIAPVGGLGTSLVVAGIYAREGSEEQKRSMLSRICAGKVQAIAMTEPEAGSDAAAIRTRARRDGERLVIDGQKTFISNAQIADAILLVARTDDGEDRHQGLTLIEVPADAPGVEIRPIRTLGGSEVNDVYFSECAVPTTAIVGGEGRAWGALMDGLNEERLIGSAIHYGQAQRAFEDALAYVKERRQFGRPIGSFQALAHRLADLAAELECCRLLVYDLAGRMAERPQRISPREASLAKLKVTETAKRVALEGLQMMGGYGYSCEYEMEYLVRTSLVGTIYGGTSEIQRTIVARGLGLGA